MPGELPLMPAWQAEMAAIYTLRVEAAFPSSNNCCRNSRITPSAQLMGACCRAAHHRSKLRHLSVYRAGVDTARALCIVATTASDKPDAMSLHLSGARPWDATAPDGGATLSCAPALGGLSVEAAPRAVALTYRPRLIGPVGGYQRSEEHTSELHH